MIQIQTGKLQQVHHVIGQAVALAGQGQRLAVELHLDRPAARHHPLRVLVVREARRHPHHILVIRAALRRALEREDHVSAVKHGIRRRVLIVHKHTAGKFGQQLSERSLRVRAAAGRDKAHAVSRMNDGAQRRLPLVHGQRCGHRRLAAQNDALPVQRDNKALPVPAEYVGIGVAVHQQNVAQRQHAAAEQLRGFPVEQDDIAVVQQPKPRRDRDAQRRGVLGVV